MLTLLLAAALAAQDSAVATVTIHGDWPTYKVPLDYIGLSYESMQLDDPEFFSASNRGLVDIFRRLSPHGVLRLGGNSSELSWWKPTPDASLPPEVKAAAERTGHGTNRTPYAITPASIDHLAGFLNATGWTLIYGLNFGAGTPERDSAEAVYVADKVGSRLKSFQIGNEPDLYTTAENSGRARGWGFPDYLKEWAAIANAVTKRVPSARFGGPDVAGGSDWVVRFGDGMKPLLGDRLTMLTGHYYAMGPAGGKGITIEHLLSPQARVESTMEKVEADAKKLGLVYRMTEGNSCYRGGQAGVSNAFAAALWSGDYLMDMAAHGNAGVNLHGGGGRQISLSLGDHLPGARNDADLALAKLGSFYTPIAGSREAGFTARPVFWGMKLAQMFAGKTLVRTTLEAAGANATAYAARDGNGYLVVLFNKDLARDLTVRLEGVSGRHAQVWRLTAPYLDGSDGITFAGMQVNEDGSWASPRKAPVDPSKIALPHGSAALVFVSR